MCEHLKQLSALSRAEQLWALLHNSAPPEGRWTDASRRYYEQVAVQFDSLRDAGVSDV